MVHHAGEDAPPHRPDLVCPAEARDRWRRRRRATEEVRQRLREQVHEYANRLHSVAALVALGEHEEARDFVAELMRAEAVTAVVVGDVAEPTLAGILLVEIALARHRGIGLEVDPASRVARLPGRVPGSAWVDLVESLVEYVCEEAVDGCLPAGRRVVLLLRNDGPGVVVQVREPVSGVASRPSPREVSDVPAIAADARHPLRARSAPFLDEAVRAVYGTLTLDVAGASVHVPG